jgi:hypothetical protein
MKENIASDRGLLYGILMLLLMTALGPVLSGCAGRKIAVPGGVYASPEAALQSLAASGPAGTITVTARIEINSQGKRYPMKAAMMMKRPASLRLESIPLLGPSDFFLSVDGGELCVFLPGKGTFYKGRATAANMSRFFPLALPADEIVPLLMGYPPEEGGASSYWQGAWEEGLYRVDRYKGMGRTLSLWIEPAGNLLIRARTFTEREDIAYTVDFTEHARVGEGFMPQRLTITGENISLAIRYTEILPLGDDETSSFSLPVPEGITPVPLD